MQEMKQKVGGTSAASMGRAAHSQALDLLRFPLALVVLAVHVFGVDRTVVYGKDYVFQGMPAFDAVQNFVFSFLSEYSLSIYFFISGYVFFLGVADFTPQVYGHKLRNRVKTLLIPFIVWNVIAALVELAYFVPPLSALRPGLDIADVDFSLRAIMQTFWDARHGIFGNVYPVTADGSGEVFPQDSPLWFLRVLMVMVLLTPVLHWIVKRAGFYFVGAAYLAWTAAYLWGNGIAIEFTTALFPFSFGAYMSINGRDMMATFGKCFKVSAVAYVALSVVQFVSLYEEREMLYLAAKALAAPAALVFVYNMSAWLLRSNLCRVVPLLASASFFIYVAHYIFVRNVVRVLAYVVMPESQWAVLAVHLSAILLIGCGLLGVFWLMQRYTPRLLKFVAGRK